MLKAALSGSYVNFGVFRLYGDDALDNALQTFIKLLLSIPHSDLLVSLKHHWQDLSPHLVCVFLFGVLFVILPTLIEYFSGELTLAPASSSVFPSEGN